MPNGIKITKRQCSLQKAAIHNKIQN